MRKGRASNGNGENCGRRMSGMNCARALRWGVAAATAAALALPLPAWASPTEDVKGIIDRVLMILTDPNLKPQAKAKERRAAIRMTVRERFNFAEMARRGLAAHWHKLTPAEQQHFVRLFTDLLERAYLDKLEYLGDETFSYLGEQIDGDTATVNSKVVTKKNLEIPIGYKLFQVNGRWEVYDFLIDGVSLMSNYRQRFSKILGAKSYPELVRMMRVKLEGDRDD
jgi:phospholipid transport system substrate-binding protein